MSGYKATIGLEIHAELKTQTKMFCACLNNPDEKAPNLNICPVCMAHPGALPVMNKEAIHKVLLVGRAVGGTLADFTEFDRKNYFYPDIPKGYQISQYEHPLVKGGTLAGVELTRIHLEEDTARSQHVADPDKGRVGDPDKGGKGEESLVDYNRAGVPLMELVTEPVLHDAKSASTFARELQLLLRTLGAGEANMEKGEMRVEANISVSKDDTLGTKVEVKNLNSFRSVEGAIDFEIKRQIDLLEKGEKVSQETRGWDEGGEKTFSQRKKESSHDYRYFPDPDLPKLSISELPEFSGEQLTKELPELPWAKRDRLAKLGFLQAQDIEQLLVDEELSQFFEAVSKQLNKPEHIKTAANLILNYVAGIRKEKPEFIPEQKFFIQVIESNLPAPQTKSSILSGVMASVADASELDAIAKKVIDANPTVVADFKSGKEAAMQFLVGQGMKESKGSANPATLKEALLKLL